MSTFSDPGWSPIAGVPDAYRFQTWSPNEYIVAGQGQAPPRISPSGDVVDWKGYSPESIKRFAMPPPTNQQLQDYLRRPTTPTGAVSLYQPWGGIPTMPTGSDPNATPVGWVQPDVRSGGGLPAVSVPSGWTPPPYQSPYTPLPGPAPQAAAWGAAPAQAAFQRAALPGGPAPGPLPAPQPLQAQVQQPNPIDQAIRNYSMQDAGSFDTNQMMRRRPGGTFGYGG